MDVLKKIWFLSWKDWGDKFVLALILHIAASIVLGFIPLANLYIWAGLVMLILVKCNVLKA